MTHEELLYRVNWASERYHDTDGRAQYFNALRAVVEEHKPIEKVWTDKTTDIFCESCGDAFWIVYPCRTIQAIEKALQ